jgi:hypothetical protein
MQTRVKNMFKPPSVFKDRRPVLEFKNEIRANGALVSSWVPKVERPIIIPNGTPGRVGEIVDIMRRGEACIQRPAKTPWTPPSDYEFIAKYLPDEQSRINFISKCETWFNDNPPRLIATPREKPIIDTELILALYKKYPGAVPPFEERMKVCRAAGYSEEYIAKRTERQRKFTELADERQKAIDAVFGKWPTANKATPKPKGKVIKAVKKRT